MKTIALVASLVFSFASAGGLDDLNPLITQGTYYVEGNQTTYVIEFRNNSKLPIEGMKIDRVGLAIHNKTFRPQLDVPTIPAGKKYTFKVNLKGALVGANPSDHIGVEGTFRHGRRKHFLIFSRPKDCLPKIGGG